MTYPTVHLNGTSKEELLRQAEDAYKAVEAAREALARMTPHGRDYYPQGPEVITEALEEHRKRVVKLLEVRDEIMEFVQHIWDTYGG